MITVSLSVIRVSVMGMALPPVTNTAIRELMVSVCHNSANKRSALPQWTNERQGVSVTSSSTMSCHCISISHPLSPPCRFSVSYLTNTIFKNSGIGSSVSSRGQNSMKVYIFTNLFSFVNEFKLSCDDDVNCIEWFLGTVTRLLKKIPPKKLHISEVTF